MLAVISACLFYAPAFFFQRFVAYLEVDQERKHTQLGWLYVAGIFAANASLCLSKLKLFFSREPNANKVNV